MIMLNVKFEKIVGGGQALTTLSNGKKAFVWGVLPGEVADISVRKKKSSMIEGVASRVVIPSNQRVAPQDPDSYLSTSPWQIMSFSAEQHYKAMLIEEAFELHHQILLGVTDVYTDKTPYHYRNKVEFSWYGQNDSSNGTEILDLAFFRRGSKGKITIDQCSLLPNCIMQLAKEIRDFLQAKQIQARQLKTLLIRADQTGNCIWQLYIKEPECSFMSQDEAGRFSAVGGAVIYSDPKSPASIITNRLFYVGDTILTDTILGIPFRYAAEGFFQINLPVYEQALRDMQQWVTDKPVIDLYSGVGSIGLTIGRQNITLVEINANAVREMKQNITQLGRSGTTNAVLAASEEATRYITNDSLIIVDPPRAGLHPSVVRRLLEETPERIIYLSCNPVTQARDIALLTEKYGIRYHRGYNFFPRTPHIEHLVVLDSLSSF